MKASSPAKPSRIPLLLSAFICPGAGQFMQRRIVAGIVFMAGFLGGFFRLIWLAGKTIIAFYKLGFEFDTYEPAPVAPSSLIIPLAVAGIFYLMNLFDVVIARQRITRLQREATFANRHLAPIQKKTPPPPTPPCN